MKHIIATLLVSFILGLAAIHIAILQLVPNEGYTWNLVHLASVVVSFVFIWFLANRLVMWAIFPYTAGFVAISHQKDINQ
jgi:hypothetical protein